MGTGRYGSKHTSALPEGVRERVPDSSNKKVKSFRQLSAEAAAKEYDAAYKAMRSHDIRTDFMDKGMNSTALQYLVNKLGMHEPGAVLPDKDFDRQAKTEALDGVVLYRGSSDRAIQNIMYGDKMYIGEGIHGDGLYLTTSTRTAKSYSYGGPNSTVTMYIDKSLANVVKESTLRNMLSKEPANVRNSFMGNGGLAAYGIYKGYNVIHAPGGNGATPHKNGGEDYYVPLTRRVLIMREHSKIK